MAYANGRVFYDADSHIMELPGFLKDYADPDIRDKLPKELDAMAAASGLKDSMTKDGHPAEEKEKLIALGDGLISGPKNYQALGAFNGSERSKALDLLGFEKQLVFVSFSAGPAFDLQMDLKTRYGAARAANRGMADFCSGDDRLLGVGVVSLDDTQLAIQELEFALDSGLSAIWIPHRHCDGKSPGHNDLDPFWARLQEAKIPFVLHIGGARLQIEEAWMNTGRPKPLDFLSGVEVPRSKDFFRVHQEAEKFIGCLVLDGVLERHPNLQGAVVELGASWVPPMLDRLDMVAKTWSKIEPDIAALKRKPSEQILQQLSFTPYVFEDVGNLINQSSPDIYLFSSDYPHTEGGRDPIGKFSKYLEGMDESVHSKFFTENFARTFSLS